jgi:hypothetical protein
MDEATALELLRQELPDFPDASLLEYMATMFLDYSSDYDGDLLGYGGGSPPWDGVVLLAAHA